MMKKKPLWILGLVMSCFYLLACGQNVVDDREQSNQNEVPKSDSKQESEEGNSSEMPAMIDLNITIGNATFPVKLYENQTTRAWIGLLPMTIDMSELNGNEKFYYLPDKLPTDPERPGQIRAGDIMLYGDDCLVVFYETFSSSYRYTRLGYVEDATGLARAVGVDSIKVTFELVK